MFGALELGLRVGGYGRNPHFFLDGSKVEERRVLIDNREFGRWVFPQGMDRAPFPNPFVLNEHKQRGTYRIFVLGESAAMGFPEPSFSFSRVLEIMLRERYPDTRFEVVNAAMCAFSGSRHGRTSARAEQFIGELEDAESAGALFHARLRAGEEIPGFGHPLYPDGDPRARLILRLLAEDFQAEFAKIQRKIIDSEGVLRQSVNLDLAVAVVAKVLGLPVHSGFHLFALGRTVGWIAHALEQHQSGEFIRPRARYTGVMPVMPIGRESKRSRTKDDDD